MVTVTPTHLQLGEALHEVPVTQLQWFIDNSSHYELEEGDLLFKKGDAIAGTYIIISGKCKLFIDQQKGERMLGFLEPNEITGYLPFSRGLVATVSGLVVEKMQVMAFPITKIKELIEGHFELTQALVHVMTSRVREFTSLQQQNEKMMALGKLSAGLAHELNNPAAAIVRGSISLKKHLQLQPETFKQVISIKITSGDVDRLNAKLFEVLARNDKPVLTLMQRMEKEDELVECLNDLCVSNGEELAENLVEFGFTCNDIKELFTIVPKEHLSPVLNWINNNLVTEKMVNDIQEASQRIDKLINSVKNFTHMDRDQNKEMTDIHAGLRNTLTMLDFKRKKGNVAVVENYDFDMPPVKAFVGELNQVWTNLIDNALDAMENNRQGELQITTQRDKDDVVVTIRDNGPGIPDEIQSRIFEPFFTTKDIGKGTGLGLDVVSKIVKQHKGNIRVNSQPGKTEFVVCFPING